MNKGANMRKKAMIAVTVFILTTSTYVILCQLEKQKVEATLNGFYHDFIHEDYGYTHQYFSYKYDLPGEDEDDLFGSMAQYLIQYRHWYGEINGIQIHPVLWLGKNKRLAFVTVHYANHSRSKTERVTLGKVNEEWLISRYVSKAPVNLPR